MKSFVSILSLSCLGAAQTISIPLGFGPGDGVPYINVTLGDARVPFNIVAGIFSQFRASCPPGSRMNHEMATLEMQFPSADGRVVRYNHPDVSSVCAPGMGCIPSAVTLAEIAVGRTSALVRDFGSVDIVRNPGRLVLNETNLNRFLDYCEPGSELTIPLTDEFFRLSIATGDVITDDFTGYVGMGDPLMIIGLYSSHFDELCRMIGPNYFEGDPIRDCLETRRRLPNITLTFSALNGASPTGQLILYPEDYTQFKPNGSCTLLLLNSQTPFAFFNPVKLSHVNVRFTTDSLVLCDSRDQQL